MTEKQAKTLAKLTAISPLELSDKQSKKLEKLTKKTSTDATNNSKRKCFDDGGAAQAMNEQAAKKAARAKQPVAVVGPVTDAGHWGANGEWEYPADKSLTCGTCKETFTFTGTEQAWYAEKSLYAPARCAVCIAAKKSAREEKQKAGVSGAGRCFNCGESGHRSAECPKPVADAASSGGRKACYVCGSDAHLSRNCPNAQTKAKGCFTCGSSDHLSRSCPLRPTPVCFNCGSEGHASKACGKPQRTSGVCFAFAKGQCFSKKCRFTH